MFYFAYGSNLNEKQLVRRCGKVEKVQNFQLPGFQLVFDTGNMYRSYANVRRNPAETVEGVIFWIDKMQEHWLDMFEGVDSGCYAKEYVPISRVSHALVYTGLKPTNAEPDPDYLGKIYVGAKAHGLLKTPKIVENIFNNLYPDWGKIENYELH